MKLCTIQLLLLCLAQTSTVSGVTDSPLHCHNRNENVYHTVEECPEYATDRSNIITSDHFSCGHKMDTLSTSVTKHLVRKGGRNCTSQQATELLFGTWTDLESWPKRNDSSSLCERDVERAISAYLTGELWALHFFDSWASPGPSLLQGRNRFVGSYYQCTETVAPELNNSPGFKGQYCDVALANLSYVFQQTNIRFVECLQTVSVGTCMPGTCSPDDITKLLQERIQALNISSQLMAKLTDCRTEIIEYTTFTRLAIIITAVIGTLSVLGTIVDTMSVQKPTPTSNSQETHKPVDIPHEPSFLENISGHVKKLILAFSLWSNGQKLLRTSEAPGSFSVISGIRFFTMSWILWEHVLLIMEVSFSDNGVHGISRMTNSKLLTLLKSLGFGVDSFFAIRYAYVSYMLVFNRTREVQWVFLAPAYNSKYWITRCLNTSAYPNGFLVSYLSLKSITDKGWNFNWKHFYLHRYFRLTPPFLIVFILTQGLKQFLVSGAMASSVQPNDKINCQQRWWILPLYVNNLLEWECCFSQSWSLAADFQFYLISPLMLIPFYYHRYAGIASCLLFTFVQWIIAGVMKYQNQWQLEKSSDDIHWLYNYYYPSYTRIAPFAIGILAGYIMYSNSGRIKMKSFEVAAGWILTVVMGYSLLFLFPLYVQSDRSSSGYISTFLFATGRSIWGMCTLWVIIACSSGYGGPVNAILTWPPFMILGRVAYMGYLTQIVVIQIIFENLEQAVFLNFTSLIVFGVASLFFTCIVSIVLTVCVEYPTLNLERSYFKKH